MENPIFTFDTTHHALWAEEVAKEAGIPYEVVPAPEAANAKCSIAIGVLPEDREVLARALEERNVSFRVFGVP